MSQKIVEDGIPFDVQNYEIEGTEGWSLEVATTDGTSIVWDDLFSDDEVAFVEALIQYAPKVLSPFKTAVTT